MKIKVSLLSLSLLAAFAANASLLTPSQAVQRLSMEGRHYLRGGNSNPEYIGEIKAEDGKPAIYVYTYSGDKGFMLLSADDAVPCLLGYSENNAFSIEDMSPSTRSFLNLYAGEIQASRGCAPYKANSTRANEWAAIPPMMTTTWDQGNPYNSLCPRINGRKSVTGCVATAMAQVMKYWEYPLTGKGSISYSPESMEETLSMDFSETTFDWASMQDSYSNGYSSLAATAVATLMKACGYSVKMKYTSSESGAYSRDISTALVNYFGYDKDTSRKSRSDFTQDQWNSMVYDNLSRIGPVIYGGNSTGGAHCFVCDGYDGNGMFHINWGWGGVSDGYFLLNELTPSAIGTGGHYGGYNMSQDAIFNIMPPVGRLALTGISIDNAADDSGNVSGWGYTYRISDFSNILLSVELKIGGGHVSSPLYVTVYETDPETKKNGNIVLDRQFEQPINASDGTVSYSTYLNLSNCDVSKFYTVNVAYELKGQKTTIGSVRMAASSGVDDVLDDSDSLRVYRMGDNIMAVSGSEVVLQLYNAAGALVGSAEGIQPAIKVNALPGGVYIARAADRQGAVRTLRLLLK